MKYMFTKHARKQMMTRGIEPREAIHAIERGSKFRQTEGLLAVYGYIQVAYRVQNEIIVIKTVMIR